MKIKTIIIWGASLLCFSNVYANTESKTSMKRYALFTASNNGGLDRIQLRHAESDALAMSKVFGEIGGVNSSNNKILLSPSKNQLKMSLNKILKDLQKDTKKTERIEFVFYYSGHSDEEGLLLKDGKYRYQDLRNDIKNINADIKIAILDSCQSGMFTRLKGGSKIPPFLMNSANQITGSIFLAASSATEASQESDAIGGSFFTHHFVSALRGASDISGDKQVTLNEAYQYAYQETLAQTETSLAGAQHPEYNIQIAGAGDIVLTDIKSSTAMLTIPQDITGKLYIRDSNNSLVLELNKIVNKPVSVALEPNKYSITLEKNPDIYTSALTLEINQNIELNFKNFRPTTKTPYRSRGNALSKPIQKLSLAKKNRGKFFNQVSLGFYNTNINFPSRAGSSTVNIQYNGYIISYSRKITRDVHFGIEFYEQKGKGVLRGASSGVEWNFFSKWISSDQKLGLYTGLFVLREKLYGLSEEYILEKDLIHKNSNNNRLGIEIPFGIRMAHKNINIDISTKLKWTNQYSKKYYSAISDFTGIGIKVGYTF